MRSSIGGCFAARPTWKGAATTGLVLRKATALTGLVLRNKLRDVDQRRTCDRWRWEQQEAEAIVACVGPSRDSDGRQEAESLRLGDRRLHEEPGAAAGQRKDAQQPVRASESSVAESAVKYGCSRVRPLNPFGRAAS